jgi:hypothetical protein
LSTDGFAELLEDDGVVRISGDGAVEALSA